MKGDIIRVDVNKILLDADHESELREEDLTKKFRYSIINAAVGYIAKVTHSSVKHKKYVGKLCYQTSGVTNFLNNETERFVF